VSKARLKVIVNDPHALAVIAIVRVQLVQSDGEVSAARVLDGSGVDREKGVVVLDRILRLQYVRRNATLGITLSKLLTDCSPSFSLSFPFSCE
jgi:hypothetical protein